MLLLALSMLLFAKVGWSEVWVQVGTGTTFAGHPFNSYYADNRDQVIYLKSELSPTLSAGPITKIAFNFYASIAGYYMNNFNIRMGHTTKTTYTSPYSWDAPMTTVYSIPQFTWPGGGWYTFVLQTPFMWDGTSNLVIEVCHDNSDGDYGNYNYVESTYTYPTYYNQYALTDYGAGCSLNPPTSIYSYRANARIYQPSTGTLNGTVTSSYSGAPIAGATVSGNGFLKTTNAAGFYTGSFWEGTWNMTAAAPPTYLPQTKTVTIPPNGTATLNFALAPNPGTLAGIVTNAANGNPVVGARVVCNSNVTYSVIGGAYSLGVFPVGTFPATFGKAGFNDTTTAPITLTGGVTTPLNMALKETCNKPGTPFTATLNTGATAVNLAWNIPSGLYELIYDDGIPEMSTVWGDQGNMNAVRFTGLNYPIGIIAGKVHIGNAADYPPGTDPTTLAPFQIQMYDATGTGGSPGAPLGDPVDVQPANFGWNLFTLPGMNLTAGSFYLVMIQGGVPPAAARLAVDTTASQLRSWSRYVSGSGPWLPAQGNFLMRATVIGSGGPLDAVAGVLNYDLYRLLQGQEGQDPATWTHISSPTGLTGIDNSWPSLGDGAYRWGVRAKYTGNRWSAFTFSNALGKNWTAPVTVNVNLTCPANPIAGTIVTLHNVNFDSTYSATLTTSNTVSFPTVWKGNYNLSVSRFNYTPYNLATTIMGPMTYDVNLLQIPVSPTGMQVDEKTLLATWNPPSVGGNVFEEDWSSGSFATQNWDAETNWEVYLYFGNPSPAAWFYWYPEQLNYEFNLTSDNITPSALLPGAHNIQVGWDIYLSNFLGAGQEHLTAEIWNGTAWETLKDYANTADIIWVSDVVPLASSYDNKTFKIRFRSWGGDSFWINYYVVDNIFVAAEGEDLTPCILAYNIYLKNLATGTEIVSGQSTDTNFTIPYTQVEYGTNYRACVTAIYGSGYSQRSCDDFNARFLCPPSNLTGTPIESTAYLTWEKPSCTGGCTVQYLMYDNGIAINGLSIYAGNQIKLGNYFPLDPAASGIIQGMDMWFTSTTSSSAQECIVYFYDAGFNLIGTSDPFINYGTTWPTGTWVNVPIADLPYSGPFYAMVDYYVASGVFKNYFGFETSTPQVLPYGLAYVQASGVFYTLYNYYGYGPPATWLQRATVCAYGKDGPEVITLDPAQVQIPVTQSVTSIQGSAVNCGPNLSVATGEAPGQMNAPAAGPAQLGYKVYRDGAEIAYIPDKTILEYYDYNLNPGTYAYEVSAWYDVNPIPPFEDESYHIGPVDVVINYGRPLPFFEPWDMGTFTFNDWVGNNNGPIGPNWTVNTGFGNPAPSADFSWLPATTGYSQMLASPILSAAAYTCADIYFDCDVKLVDRNATEEEFLDLEVFKDGGWGSKLQLTNAGSFDWTPQHVKLSGTCGKAFRVGLLAHGENSEDILHWYVDNIHVYAVCRPPQTLVKYDIQDQDVYLSWSGPDCKQGPPATWLTWDDGTNVDAIGLIAGGSFDLAAKWDPDMIAELAGGSITKVRIFPYDPATFIFRVWQGPDGSNLVYEQPFTPAIGDWYEINVTSPVALDVGQALWVGYNVTHSAGTYPAGVGPGPCAIGYGFLANLGAGWEDLSAYFDYNWDIEVLVETAKGSDKPAVILTSQPIVNASAELSSAGLHDPIGQSFNETDASSLEGYNVYRSDDNQVTWNMLNTSIVPDTTYADMGVPYGEHFYYVSAVFTECESEPSNIIMVDVVTGINQLTNGSVQVYPNPATEIVSVKSNFTITNIEVMNFLGQTVYTQQGVDLKATKINVSNLQAGIYFVKVTTVQGVRSVKIMVTH